MEEKKIKGRKRHIAVDSMGNLLHVEVHAANEHDTMAGGRVTERAISKYDSIEVACVDLGYRGTTVNYIMIVLHKRVIVSGRISSEWAVIPKRWVVERTFAWFNGYRRLAKDFEISIASAENGIRIAHCSMLLRRLVAGAC